jgi:hypothetical protein
MDRRKMIGSVRSKNWSLAISRDRRYRVVDAEGSVSAG